MLRLRTSDEFARWFAALDQPTAEDVTATLEVIVQLGPEKEAPGSSEWLTWYEHPLISGLLRDFPSFLQPHPPARAALARFVREWGAFNTYARRAIRHLESPAFVARLRELDAKATTSVRDAIARIKRVTTTRVLAVSDKLSRIRPFDRLPPTPRQEAALAELADIRGIRNAYHSALAAAGFEVADLPAEARGLREIGLRSPPPGLRLLYGIDPATRSGLVLLGERFDRSFYGDSVRRAEQMWHEFLVCAPAERASP